MSFGTVLFSEIQFLLQRNMETSQSIVNESVNSDSESNSTNKCYKKKSQESNICPFKLEWSFGINPDAPLLNLTTENRSLIAYACSHVVMIYDYRTKEMFPLQGHQNAVRVLSITRDGKWLLTADFEQDCAVVIWDTESRIPIHTLFNPHGKEGIAAAHISPDAKYIVTIGKEKCQNVCLWEWTYGKEEPDASIELSDSAFDKVKEITFEEPISERFIVTADYNVFFFTWKGNQLYYYRPKVLGKSRRYGIFNSTCYVPKTQQALTATTNGFVLVWSNEYNERSNGKMINEDKRHIKSFPLQKHNITVILVHEGMIVTGDFSGCITFYDDKLKLLYWCQNCGFDCIRSISFHLESKLTGPKLSITSEFDLDLSNEDTESGLSFEVEAENGKKEKTHSQSERKTDTKADFCPKLTLNIEPTLCKPTDCTLLRAPFYVKNFFVCTSTGAVALMDIPNNKCHFIFLRSGVPLTAMDAHSRSDFIITGNTEGLLSLYNYRICTLITSRKIPALPDFRPIVENQVKNDEIIYVTCPHSHENLTAVTALKYSPLCDMLICALENGAFWVLHPIILEALDEVPYKHSSESITKIVFSECSKYMAYSDNSLTIAVFKRNKVSRSPLQNVNYWNFIGKYHSHYLPITDILFGPAVSDSTVPRLFSLGEDQDLIEYDLANSGPYPEPGLKLLQIHRIEHTGIPLCMTWYPVFGSETFLLISNSEYKYRLLNDVTKMICGTFLGPTFGAPVQQFKVLSCTQEPNKAYMVFATEKEIGLQSLPLDGNPYKTVGIIGHSRQITHICVNADCSLLFTLGRNDPCVLIWKIKLRSLDIMTCLGGKGLSPFYSLIEGGREGWLLNEMQELFYYAQILHQEKYTIDTCMVSDLVSIKQIPNLLRALGYFPSNEELKNIINEVSYKNYTKTGRIREEIAFEDFVKLYVNHRPVFGLSVSQMREAFHTFVPNKSANEENSTLTREQFVNVLLGHGFGKLKENEKPFGEPFTAEEARTFLKLLISGEEDINECTEDSAQELVSPDYSFLPSTISYKDFATDIMGIDFLEDTRADNEESA